MQVLQVLHGKAAPRERNKCRYRIKFFNDDVNKLCVATILIASLFKRL